MGGKVVNVSEANFQQEVIEAELPVLVDFWAPWCGPCRALAPDIEQLAEQFDGKVKVCKVNTDENQDLARRYNIHSIPTLFIFQKGEQKEMSVGRLPKSKLVEMVSKYA